MAWRSAWQKRREPSDYDNTLARTSMLLRLNRQRRTPPKPSIGCRSSIRHWLDYRIEIVGRFSCAMCRDDRGPKLRQNWASPKERYRAAWRVRVPSFVPG